MRYGLHDRVIDDIIRYAKTNAIEKVILFGSRARGDNAERSDIDLAVLGGNAPQFHEDIEEEAWTLLKFDVVDLDQCLSAELRKEIERDGITLYKKI